MSKIGDNVRRPDPTPEEIAERCREIQAGWSEFTRLQRQGIPIGQITRFSSGLVQEKYELPKSGRVRE